jgi:hypothetical protein
MARTNRRDFNGAIANYRLDFLISSRALLAQSQSQRRVVLQAFIKDVMALRTCVFSLSDLTKRSLVVLKQGVSHFHGTLDSLSNSLVIGIFCSRNNQNSLYRMAPLRCSA